jgi:hypothetical protein
MAQRNVGRRVGGSATTGLLVVLVLLLGAGAFNYYRNFQAEQRTPRPYRSYSDAQLNALVTAYKQEVKGLDAASPKGSLRAGPSGQLLGERVAAFQRVQAAGDARRRAEERSAGQEGILRSLEQEQALRQRLGSGLALHLHRLLSF